MESYICLNCRHSFNTPLTHDDVEGDEQYDVCPKCHSDDIALVVSEITKYED